ncbi:sigma-54 dependent transcriptional regulator [Parahaliea mediterranea]|uniref:Sigma-54-dependent Fis family transcriptional regulator n=1 Tax=Parahaliea mediterranea TaxID=651086 RepID=A0A939DC16_9GAMM|nr:sigma-54 dependent transcriptional regulator [Parahaliea mediterranea]MBN7795264.1 sigma-54-dependent Fis family transcriptional regulator [Parahaliea mediterranea]
MENSQPNRLYKPPEDRLAERHLLYLQPNTDSNCNNALLWSAIEDNGWSVDVIDDYGEAVRRMETEKYSVGLVHCDGQAHNLQKLHYHIEALSTANSRTNLVAMLSSSTDISHAIASVIYRYFYDYHTLPVDTERLLVTLGHAHGMARVANDMDSTAPVTIEGMIGQSPPIMKLRQEIQRVASSEFNVLVRGESGTGKELTANAIHQLSRRSSGPFIPVHCGALPKDLIQAELFGHEKGAFTGADKARIGKIEAAQNGTLFLDEIGDLPLDMQTNLLRFLQEGSIDRIGGSTQIPLNVRTIAATNVNLEKAVKEGRFREDLYYRLNVLQIDTPALRDRGEDIGVLSSALFSRYAREVNPSLKGFTQQAVDAMNNHHWPGNVREMVNRIRRAVVMCEGKLICIRNLGLDQNIPSNLGTLAQAREAAEKETIEATLAYMRNNVSKTARQLDISRVTLYRLMEFHNIDWQSNKT